MSKKSLTPKLRFPEFRDGPGWAPISLVDVTNPQVRWSFTGGPFGSNLIASDYTTQGVRIIQLQNIGDGEFLDDYKIYTSTAKADELLSCNAYPGDIVLSKMGDPVGRACIVPSSASRFVMCSDGIRLVVDEERFDRDFVFFSVNFGNFRRRVDSVATGSTRKRVGLDTLRQLPLDVPGLLEQRKIAGCLASLDELIAAEGRKLDTLRAYKKGLMQQLFPRDGETTPRLRFPEFRDAGEWVKKPFSDLSDINHGYAFEGEYFNNEGEYVLLTPGNFYEQGGYRDRGEQQKYYTGEIPPDYVLAQGDMLVAMTEQAAGLLGSPILVPQSDKFLHNQRLGLVTGKPGVAWANEFFFHVFNTEPVRKAIHETASGTKVRHTSPTKIGEVAVSAPTSSFEQQRIAECLSSLDHHIAAESRKIEGLKQHKKGLMQQLFPAAEASA